MKTFGFTSTDSVSHTLLPGETYYSGSAYSTRCWVCSRKVREGSPVAWNPNQPDTRMRVRHIKCIPTQVELADWLLTGRAKAPTTTDRAAAQSKLDRALDKLLSDPKKVRLIVGKLRRDGWTIQEP